MADKDFSHLSDEDLEKIVMGGKGEAATAPRKDFSHMSDDDLLKIAMFFLTLFAFPLDRPCFF